jgi:hypothetical protein
MFEAEVLIAMVEAAKDLTIHSTGKDPADTVRSFEKIYQAIASAVITSQDQATYKPNPSK